MSRRDRPWPGALSGALAFLAVWVGIGVMTDDPLRERLLVGIPLVSVRRC